MKTILITGGTGLIGMALSRLLQAEGYRVLHLSRRANPQALFPAYHWDVAKGEIDEAALLQANAIVHLAGEGIADKRWTPQRKRAILDSRVQSTQLLVRKLAQLPTKPALFLSGSAIGYYGNRGAEPITEQTTAGTDFMADVCRQWEQAAAPLPDMGIRTAWLRIGIVLMPQGGALAKMLPSYRFRLGAYFGNGQQYYAWIHWSDICRAILFLLQHPTAQGTFNLTAPNPVPNYALAKAIAQALDQKTCLLPAPQWVLRLAMGEMADMILNGNKVLPAALESLGFRFQFPDIQTALRDMIGVNKNV